MAYYQLRKHDRHKDLLLVGGGVLGAGASLVYGLDIQGTLLTFMPWCLLLSLVLSPRVHQVLERSRARRLSVEELVGKRTSGDGGETEKSEVTL
jgi:membrane protein implicated in regulation of membrane protease activity